MKGKVRRLFSRSGFHRLNSNYFCFPSRGKRQIFGDGQATLHEGVESEAEGAGALCLHRPKVWPEPCGFSWTRKMLTSLGSDFSLDRNVRLAMLRSLSEQSDEAPAAADTPSNGERLMRKDHASQ